MSFNWPQGDISSDLSRKAIRQTILESIYLAKSGHPGGSLSLVEILASIYAGNFEQTVDVPERADRDRLVLSKGHGVPALYAAMSFLGFFPALELAHLRQLGHFLQGHPDRDKFRLMEASTGSLGQGASVALGLALGLRLSFSKGELPRLPRVYCILGDGEMQEGQVWECLMAAGKFRTSNLIFILDRNRSQIDGDTEEVMPLDSLDDKIRAFNLNVTCIDGHDVGALKKFFSSVDIKAEGRSQFLIANTIKGKGVSFMENQIKWHGAAPSKEQLESALTEIIGTEQQYPFGRLF
jgi:transketolase